MRLVVLVLVFVAGCRGREESKPTASEGERPHSEARQPSSPPPRCSPGVRTICVRDAVVECAADGALGRTLETCKGACRSGACVDTCAVQDVELIYVIDDAGNLLSFDPRKLPGDPFRLVGKLACDPADQPFSMAVDRSGIAWVLYRSGKVYRVSIVDAHCSSEGTVPAGAPETFGMGFVTDGPRSTTEKLLVSANDSSRLLAQLDTTRRDLRWTAIAKIEARQLRNPELTGTSEGKVYGYFPGPRWGFVQELDRSTGKAMGPQWKVEDAPGDAAGELEVSAYAFAHWGGVFYVFATAGGNSAVHAIRRETGKHELVKQRLPYRIVGAGVSTCAPLLERAP